MQHNRDKNLYKKIYHWFFSSIKRQIKDNFFILLKIQLNSLKNIKKTFHLHVPFFVETVIKISLQWNQINFLRTCWCLFSCNYFLKHLVIKTWCIWLKFFPTPSPNSLDVTHKTSSNGKFLSLIIYYANCAVIPDNDILKCFSIHNTKQTPCAFLMFLGKQENCIFRCWDREKRSEKHKSEISFNGICWLNVCFSSCRRRRSSPRIVYSTCGFFCCHFTLAARQARENSFNAILLGHEIGKGNISGFISLTRHRKCWTLIVHYGEPAHY